ncbi:MAG TPA: acyloxyacyl hydrolase [Candidatus Sulfotelmatobacter sp.]|jgi:lipid A 3-O-deacylase|nr:acyloxyacyl hydrolase [Candidatus Sulfotelmatobacter sp.]
MKKIMRILFGLGFVLAISNRAAGADPVVVSGSHLNDLQDNAGATNSGGLTLQPAPICFCKDEGGYDFHKGINEVGITLGGSFGSKIFGSSERHDFVLSKLQVGHVFSNVFAKDHWYAGNFELLGEIFGGEQVKPVGAYLAGVTPVLRYDFATGSRLVPFFDIGFGATATDIGLPDLGGTFQFNFQTGPGIHWFIDKKTVLTFQYRFLHVSSAGLETPNLGVNTSVFYLGVSRLF